MARFRRWFRMTRPTVVAVAALMFSYSMATWVDRAHAQNHVSEPSGGPEANAYAHAIAGAVRAFEAGRFEDARAGFTQAHTLQPSARTWRGIGLASYSLQDVVRARRAFEQALIDPRRPLAEAQRAEVEALLRETAQRTGRFHLQLEPVDAQVEVDGMATTERELVLAVGDHTLVVSASHHTPQQRTLHVQGAEVSTLSITLAPILATPTTAAATSQPTRQTSTPAPTRATTINDAPPQDHDRSNALPWLLLGSAPVLAAGSAVVWWSGLAERNAVERQCAIDVCTRSESDRRVAAAHLSRYETWTNVLLGASIVTAAAGATWLLLSTDNDSNVDTLTLRAGVSGLRLDGHF